MLIPNIMLFVCWWFCGVLFWLCMCTTKKRIGMFPCLDFFVCFSPERTLVAIQCNASHSQYTFKANNLRAGGLEWKIIMEKERKVAIMKERRRDVDDMPNLFIAVLYMFGFLMINKIYSVWLEYCAGNIWYYNVLYLCLKQLRFS